MWRGGLASMCRIGLAAGLGMEGVVIRAFGKGIHILLWLEGAETPVGLPVLSCASLPLRISC